MRKNESDVICQGLSDLGLINMRRINAEDAFFHTPLTLDDRALAPLCELTDPEDKRAVIGNMFINVTREAADSLALDFDTTFLAQGTLRPDLIESGNPDVSGYAHKIKTHHNDVDIVRRARERGMVIETNWDWHKDEVRRVARMLGLPEEVAARQPFPGPGLGVRILCGDAGVTADPAKAAALAEYMRTAQAKSPYAATLTPVRSVGVQGDNRSYRSLAVLSGVNDLAAADWHALRDLARDIPNALDFVNRLGVLLNRETVGGDLTGTRLRIEHDTADLLREIDDIVTGEIMTQGSQIAQCFAVLLPAGVDDKPSIAIRAVVTGDFMTARPALPGEDFPIEALSRITARITARFGDKVDMLLYDATGKPPATVEWE